MFEDDREYCTIIPTYSTQMFEEESIGWEYCTIIPNYSTHMFEEESIGWEYCTIIPTYSTHMIEGSIAPSSPPTVHI
jgi:hypothetical protein